MLKHLPIITALVLGSFTLAPATAEAARTRILVLRGATDHNVLDDVALNAAAATRTMTLTLGSMPAGGAGDGYDKLRVLVFFTHAAATTVTANFSCSLDGVNFADLTSRLISSGASTLSIVTDTHSVGADANFMIEFDVRGCASVKILLGGAGAGASDLVDAQAVAMRGF